MFWCLLPAALAQDPPGAGSLNPDLSFVADVALAGFSSEEPLQTGGHDPAVNGFNLQQLEMSVGSDVDPYFRFDANIVFSPFGVEIEEVYATTLALPARTQVRIGQLLTRFGRINATHPHAWSFVDQPFAIGRVLGAEGSRGLGAEGSILLPLPWYAEALVSQTMIGGEATGRSWAGAADERVETPLDLQTTAALKQFVPIGDALSVLGGLSWAVGPNGAGRGNRSEVYGADLFVKLRPLDEGEDARSVALQTEWLYRRQQVPRDVLADLSGYTELSWRFSQRWGAAARHELGTPTRDLDGEIATLDLDPEWTGSRQRVSTALTFWPTEFSRIRLQGARDAAQWRETADWSAFLAFEFSVGAHASHAF